MVRYTSGLHLRAADRGPTATGSSCRRCTTPTRTAAAPRTRSPSTPARASRPASPPPTGRTPSGCWPPGTRPPPTSPGPATSCRCGPRPAACCAAPGHTEAAVDLARLAGLQPAGVLCEIVKDDGTMARLRRAQGLRRRARPGADLDRRPDRLPPPYREAGRAGRRGQDPDQARRLPSPSATSSLVDGIDHVALVAATSATARTSWSGCTPSA